MEQTIYRSEIPRFIREHYLPVKEFDFSTEDERMVNPFEGTLMSVLCINPYGSNTPCGIRTAPSRSQYLPPLVAAPDSTIFLVVPRNQFFNGLHLGFAPQEVVLETEDQWRRRPRLEFMTTAPLNYNRLLAVKVTAWLHYFRP